MIIGAGFGGLSVVRSLRKAHVDITVIDRTNHHLFQPLLYQVATAGLSPGDIAHPIRSILRSMTNVHVVLDDVERIDNADRLVVGSHATYPYDALIIATGARHSYFGHDDWEAFAPGLKDLNDALLIRDRLLRTFEEAERFVGSDLLRELLTFVVVGGGPTGVELAGAIAEISRKTMLPDFPRLSADDIRVVLIEGADRILTSFDPRLSTRAVEQLQSLGVEVVVGGIVSNITATSVTVGQQVIPTRNVLWAAGNRASSLIGTLTAPKDRAGRVLVNDDCSLPGYTNTYVIGDAAHFEQDGRPLPGVAQVAMQQGAYVGRLLARRPSRQAPFRYKDLGSMATIGRARAIVEIGRLRLSGLLAWLMWAGLHVVQLISFRNRLRVLIEWGWYYVTFQPGARLLLRERNRRPS